MELKFSKSSSLHSTQKFKLYLYGIEMSDEKRPARVGYVQIVPLWNWNAGGLQSIVIDFTFKLYLYGIEIKYCESANIKCNPFKLYLYGIEITNNPETGGSDFCSNCTFMELKLGGKLGRAERDAVQIVPLWNWNAEPEKT